MIRKPTFFVVGAPRCGTTAITDHLSKHSDVFMSRPKEAEYFADDFGAWRFARSQPEYLRLFDKADDTQTAVGEGSTIYLYSDCAIGNIMTFNPAAKLIAILRSPLDAIPSLHALLLYMREEDEPSFERAWSLQEARSRGLHLPAGCEAPKLFQYRALGRYGEQVERLLAAADARQVLILLFDDLVSDPASVHAQLTSFLGLHPAPCTTIERVHDNRYNRAPSLAQWLRRPPKPVRWRSRQLQARGGLGIASRLIDLQTDVRRRSPLSDEMRGVLRSEFREDIYHLQDLIGRDLSGWLE